MKVGDKLICSDCNKEFEFKEDSLFSVVCEECGKNHIGGDLIPLFKGINLNKTL